VGREKFVGFGGTGRSGLRRSSEGKRSGAGGEEEEEEDASKRKLWLSTGRERERRKRKFERGNEGRADGG